MHSPTILQSSRAKHRRSIGYVRQNKGLIEMPSRRRPSVRLTPEDVVEYCRTRCQQPSLEDAESWLFRQKRCLEQMMSVVIKDNLERILDEATFMAYPDPVFDRHYRSIDEAIQTAADTFGQENQLEQSSSCFQEREMCEVVRLMSIPQANFMACVGYDQEFCKADENGSGNGEVLRRTERVHLTCDGGTVRAELAVEENCNHDPDVILPEKLLAIRAEEGGSHVHLQPDLERRLLN
jgi:hypothetical protein